MDNNQNSCYTKRKPFEELTLADDFLFCKVMQDESLCKELLEIILHVTIDKIKYTNTQKVLDDVIDEKSIRMDVYVKGQCILQCPAIIHSLLEDRLVDVVVITHLCNGKKVFSIMIMEYIRSSFWVSESICNWPVDRIPAIMAFSV